MAELQSIRVTNRVRNVGMIEKIQTFIQEVIFEFKKVSWPTWEELKGSTVVILLLTAFFGIMLFITDLILSRLISLIMGS